MNKSGIIILLLLIVGGQAVKTWDVIKNELPITNNYIKNVIVREAEKNKLPPALMLSLAYQENSRHNRYLISSAGAVGILQVKPIAFREVMRLKGHREYLDTNRFPDEYLTELLQDIDLNVKIGICYFRRILDKQGGNVVKALYYYNAGHGKPYWDYADKILRRLYD